MQLDKRIKAQKEDKFYFEKADYHIINDGDINSVTLKAKQIARECLNEKN